MREFLLRYGNEVFAANADAERIGLIGAREGPDPLTDLELGQRIDAPVGSSPLEEICGGGSVLIVVPDATRMSAADQVVNLLVRRLIAAGTMAYDIAVIFATGIHRPVTRAEKGSILTPFLVQRVKCLDHAPRDLAVLSRVGETASGIPVEVNKALLEFDHTISVGAVNFHYFAGFTGGRKLICPGLASSRTIAATHRLAFDFETLSRAEGVGIGSLDGNPVHKAFVEAAALAAPSFSVNTLVDETGKAVDAFCGDWLKSHETACERFSEKHVVAIAEKRPFVAVSCGGHPYDINLIQAHKALETASKACEDGGTIIFFACCEEGTGRADFIDWFIAGNSRALAERLVDSYKVNGQTAWALLEKAERFDVRMVTELPEEIVSKTGMRKISPEEALSAIESADSGWILPSGAKYLPVTK